MAEKFDDRDLRTTIQFTAIGLTELVNLKIQINGHAVPPEYITRVFVANGQSIFERDPLPAFHQYVIDLNGETTGRHAVDFDRDGADLAATAWSKGDRVVWFEDSRNPRGQWTMHVIKEKYFAANQVIAADFDGDGRPDIVATADDGSRRVQGANELHWWRNEGRR